MPRLISVFAGRKLQIVAFPLLWLKQCDLFLPFAAKGFAKQYKEHYTVWHWFERKCSNNVDVVIAKLQQSNRKSYFTFCFFVILRHQMSYNIDNFKQVYCFND